MQQWDDDNGALGFVEEAGYDDCVMEGGADPEDVGGDNYEAGDGYQRVKHEKKSSSS
jgi:RecQ family ATP-dependent DNA helicase